jgi:hypothetical protein
LVGVNYEDGGTISNCYAIGAVAGTTYVGGLVGLNKDGTISNCYYDSSTTKCSDSGKGTGLETSAMQTESTFTDAEWDFVSAWAISDSNDTSIINGGYPYLQDNEPSE